MRLYYRLTTKEPLVLSQSTATTNNHLGLDYIPGSAILGAIASRIYNQLSNEQSFALFHSGACKFGPAYPLINDEIAMPFPASWHGLKHDSDNLSNHCAPDFERDEKQQYKQLREGYINHKLNRAEVIQGITTRTALDDNLRVKEGQLFTYSTLDADQSFGGWVDFESKELLEIVKPLLNTELSVGRSRSSEFGKVQLYCSEQQPEALKTNCFGKTLVLWCLSDVQCFNSLGNPTFTPTANEINNQLNGSLNPSKSFIRTKKVRRFNRARNGLDSEQQLIAAGSVLVYDLEQPASAEVLEALAKSGVGNNKQQGLGWVNINPDWALQPNPQGKLFEPIKLPVAEVKQQQIQFTSLVNWVNNQLEENNLTKDLELKIKSIHKKICNAYENARAYNGLPKEYQAGPSSSQWRRLDELVKISNNWQVAAFDGDAAICKEKNDELGWGIIFQDGKKVYTFASFANEHLSDLTNIGMRIILEQLCRFDPSNHIGLQRYKEFNKSAKQGEQ